MADTLSPRDLDFSEEIELKAGQENSIILDRPVDENETGTQIFNFGSISAGEKFNLGRSNYVYSGVGSNIKRDYTQLSNLPLPSYFGKDELKNYELYSLKTFPRYGIYGFINYNINDEAEETEDIDNSSKIILNNYATR